MKELEECLEALLAEVKPIEKTEYVALTDACDRILGEDIVAQMMIPPYPKSAMDGYAVRAGKPVVLVVFGGRAQVISKIAKRCAAVIQAWYPGEEGSI